MDHPLDQGSLEEPALFLRMIWLGTSKGARWGALLGAVYGCILAFLEGSVLFAIITTVVGAVLGVIYGLVMGSLHGLILGLVTTFFFFPLGNERIYHGAMAATSLLVNIGIGYCLVIYYGVPLRYGVPPSISSENMFFFGWPLLIETIASLIGSQLFALWYSDECF